MYTIPKKYELERQISHLSHESAERATRKFIEESGNWRIVEDDLQDAFADVYVRAYKDALARVGNDILQTRFDIEDLA